MTTTPSVRIDLPRIRQNLQGIAAQTRVPIYAVVKADAYGLGAARIAPAIADLVEGFAVFSLAEAVDARIWESTGKPSITLGPPQTLDPQAWIANHVRPAISTVEEAAALRSADPIVCIDTGMQRFAYSADQLDAVISAGGCREAFTHAIRLDHVHRLKQLAGGRSLRLHAAATALLDEPQAWLDAVRPGLAMYRSAVRVAAPLLEVRDSRGPVGYSGFAATRHGVILCGYSNGLRKGPCLVNGQKRRIMEVGMQSAYVELGDGDRAGDEVVLLGDGLAPEEIAPSWGSTPHEVLFRLSGSGNRIYC